jgi:hypothetical protein
MRRDAARDRQRQPGGWGGARREACAPEAVVAGRNTSPMGCQGKLNGRMKSCTPAQSARSGAKRPAAATVVPVAGSEPCTCMRVSQSVAADGKPARTLRACLRTSPS